MPDFWSQRVKNPWELKVAMNANASVTPPNCARTPHTEVTSRRTRPPSRAVDTAYARSAPKAGSGRVRSGLVDRLHVVAADNRPGWDHSLPAHLARELLALRDVQIVPVEDDRRLARRDRGRCGVNRQEVAGSLECLEEVDA